LPAIAVEQLTLPTLIGGCLKQLIQSVDMLIILVQTDTHGLHDMTNRPIIFGYTVSAHGEDLGRAILHTGTGILTG
jgi:hypothetical protein